MPVPCPSRSLAVFSLLMRIHWAAFHLSLVFAQPQVSVCIHVQLPSHQMVWTFDKKMKQPSLPGSTSGTGVAVTSQQQSMLEPSPTFPPLRNYYVGYWLPLHPPSHCPSIRGLALRPRQRHSRPNIDGNLPYSFWLLSPNHFSFFSQTLPLVIHVLLQFYVPVTLPHPIYTHHPSPWASKNSPRR